MLLACAVPGCFDGAAAAGLPCEADRDCGLDVRCIEGFCGGPPATVTTVDPTVTSSSGSESTGDLPCHERPDAVCVPEVPGQPDANCNANCTLAVCGDDIHNPHVAIPGGFEECDDGIQGTPQDSENCDADCTLVACADGHFNAEAEPCDDGNLDELDGCTNACQVPALLARFDQMEWTTEPYDLSDYAGTPWETEDVERPGWAWENGQWHTLIPYREGQNEITFTYNYASVTRLVSPPFDVPEPPPGFDVQLRFRHTLIVDPDCAAGQYAQGDGGVVRLRRAGEDTTVNPVGGYGTLENECDGMSGGNPVAQRNPNPLFERRPPAAFTGPDPLDGPVVVDLTAYAGEQGVQVVFEFGSDCIHCLGGVPPSEWQIDDVIVAAFPTG